MNDAKYDDLIGHCAKVDRVREASYQGAAYLTLNGGVGERCRKDTAKCPVDFHGKSHAKPRTLAIVPVTGVE